MLSKNHFTWISNAMLVSGIMEDVQCKWQRVIFSQIVWSDMYWEPLLVELQVSQVLVTTASTQG